MLAKRFREKLELIKATM